MATFILTWNPMKWHWDKTDYNRIVSSTAKGNLEEFGWSCGNTKKIVEGDRVFLLQQGTDRGLIGAGYATSESYSRKHWDKKKAAMGGKVLYVDFDFDILLATENRLPIEDLLFAQLDVPWNYLMASGVQVPDESAKRLEQLWMQHLREVGRKATFNDFTLPDELSSDGSYKEGAKFQIIVNAYERNPEARDSCIGHWGFDCGVCGFNFVEVYGKIGEEYIHVHHLIDLASIGEEYDVDPVKDMRPVCPNCHAMLHRTKPAMSIKKLKSLLAG
jgi:5-methylcytosine-specific restriction enzyme A